MYICVIVSTVHVNDCIFCVNEQQKVYYYFLEEAALHIAGFQSPHYVLFTAVWQRNKLER